MKPKKLSRALVALASISLVAVSCGSDDESPAADTPAETAAPTTAAPTEDTVAATEDTVVVTEEAVVSSEICDAEGLVKAVQGGAEQGTLDGMADDPVATAASNNPILTTLVTAVGAAGLGDTLNGAEALTVFAPTDCAFANLDPATLEAALADPSGLLTQVLGYHVIAGQRLSAADLAGVTELETFTGAKLPISVEGETIMVGGQATVLVPDIQTANATVYLIDTVMIPPAA